MIHRYIKVILILLIALGNFKSYSQKTEIDSLKLAIQSRLGTDKVDALNELSWYYKNMDVDSAFLYAKEAVSISNNLQNNKAILSSFNALANVYDAVGLLDSSEYFHLKSLEIGQKMNDSANIAASYNNLGIVYDLKGANEKSLQMYFKSLAMYEALNNDPYSVAMVLGNIGIVYKKEKQYENVLEYYQRALDIYVHEGSDFGVMVTQGNIGSLLIHLHRYEESLKMSQLALDGYVNAGYNRYVPHIEDNMAVANDSLGNKLKARKLYLAAISKHDSLLNYNEVAAVCIEFSDFLYRQKEYGFGVEMAQRALKNARTAEAVELQISALKMMAKQQAQLGNFEQAFSSMEEYNRLTDSIQLENNKKVIFELQAKYDTVQKEKKLLTQDVELKEKELAIQFQIAIITVLFLILILIVWRFKVKKQQQKEEAKCAIKDERSRIAMDLHDHVGAELTVVTSKLDSRIFSSEYPVEKENLGSVVEQVRRISEILRETVWSIRTETITINQLENRVKSFSNPLLHHNSLQLRIKHNLPNFELTPQIALTSYRVCQEAITNAYKYSEASELNFVIEKRKHTLHFSVTDNGKGFDIASANGSGFGLENMQQRVEKLGGVYSLTSNLGSGTKIEWSFRV